MIAEKSHTAQLLIEKLSGRGNKVPFVPDDMIGSALTLLENKGIPTNKTEDYKYCNIDAVLRKEFKALDGKLLDVNDIAPFRLENNVTIAVVNGKYSPELSDKAILKGLRMGSLSEMDSDAGNLIGRSAKTDSDAFIALNTAFSSEGFFLRVEKHTALPMPVHIIYVNSSEGESLVNPRNLIILEENSELTLIEEQVNIGN